MMTSPKVGVVLLHLNQEEHTRECIRSLLAVTYDRLEIILVDNASSDGSGQRLHQEFPGVVFLPLAQNLGFSEGNNEGIRLALERGADFVMLLNNDTVVDPGFMEPLVNLALTDPSVAVQSCKIYYFSDKNRFWYAGGFFSVGKALTRHRGIMETDEGQYDSPEETDFATGCMMFMGKDVLHRVGLLDKDFFAYFEDVDWCLRANNLNYKIMYNPAAVIWHKVSGTTRIDSPLYLYFAMRNKLLLLRKHATRGQILAYLPYHCYFYGRQILRMLLGLRSLKGTQAVLWGIIDGVCGSTGEFGKGRLDLLNTSGT